MNYFFNKQSVLASFGLIILISVCLVVYWPALTGPFLLDDFVHLSKLQGTGAADNLDSFLKFVFSENYTPGRFLSFLSLLIDDFAWPTSPYSFKYTSLLIHVLNTTLVFVFVKKIIELFYANCNVYIASLLIAAIWALHPMQMSTVMYVIQRMTLLSSTFMLIGLISYIYGRAHIKDSEVYSLILMSFGIGFCGLVSICFKEIGVNILVFSFILEKVYFKRVCPSNSSLFGYWKWVFIYFPLLFLFVYFLVNSSSLVEGYILRDYTVWERMLTQPRVLLDYVVSIIIPKMSNLTIYHDDYSISRGLFSPLSTVTSLSVLILSCLVAFIARHKSPLLCFAISWFVGGHLLESTFLPLEIYFEHRNYLPMLGIVFSIVIAVLAVKSKLKKIFQLIVFLYLGLVSTMCFSVAKVWGDAQSLANVWAKEHPESVRALYDLVSIELRSGNYIAASKLWKKAEKMRPNNISYAIFDEVHFRCKNLGESRLNNELLEYAEKASFDWGILSALNTLGNDVVNATCQSVRPNQYINFVDSLINNKNYRVNKDALAFLYEANASMYAHLRNLDKAMEYMDIAYIHSPKVETPIQQAVMLMSAGLYEDAQYYINKARDTDPLNKVNTIGKQLLIEKFQAMLDRTTHGIVE